jgi:HK97 gp10 family phage protein
MSVRVKVEGLREIEAALKELPKATAKNIMRRVLIARAQPIADAMRRNAPKDSGQLRDSIAVSTRSTGGSAGKQAFAATMAAGGTRKEAGAAAREANRATSGSVFVYVGATAAGFYGSFAEFGTSRQPPEPWIRPAWDAEKDNLLPGIGADMWAEIKKAIERRSRKLAKQGG